MEGELWQGWGGGGSEWCVIGGNKGGGIRRNEGRVLWKVRRNNRRESKGNRGREKKKNSGKMIENERRMNRESEEKLERSRRCKEK